MSSLFGDEPPTTDNAGYRVLARKYRPTVFEDLIGQEILVRTLSNAIKTGRLAHAFLLTGIRGIGKTTTARLIARALNCIGPDGNGGPTIQPCGSCSNCKMIAEDRHMDVLEMDAASRTGVGDIRELIETVHYAPTSARYKIYIIDEVHMLSTSAFNALLKTLEEPPPHVKFIFATTELRKIPVTILSRCQTFELKRVDSAELTQHLSKICAKEGVEAEEQALHLIANAAEGSVRDSLSLLDQAIAHGTDESGNTQVKADAVRGMLGMGDRSRSFTLLEQALAGDAKAALASFKSQYDDGADPAYLLQELMELVHLVTRVKLVPELSESPELAEQERIASRGLAGKLGVAELTRAWQLLNKGLQETRHSPGPFMAAEMALIRLMHASSLPSPAELVRSLQANPAPIMSSGAAVPIGSGATGSARGTDMPSPNYPGPATTMSLGAPAQAALKQPLPMAETSAAPQLKTFEDVVALFEEKKEILLWSHWQQNVELVKFETGHIEIHPLPNLPGDFAGKVGKHLQDWTGSRWIVSISAASGRPTLKAQADAHKQSRIDEAASHPLVQQILERFEGAKITGITQNTDVKPPEILLEDEAKDDKNFETPQE